MDLADKLKALGVKVGTAEVSPPIPKAASEFPIEAVVDGQWVETRQGETFVSCQTFRADYRHGEIPIRLESPFDGLANWLGDSHLQDMPISALAFLDTETSGLAGGTGTYAFLVGVGRFVKSHEKGGQEVFQLQQFFMREPAEEAAMLEALLDFLAPCQALVTFNGKAFDAPLLATRYTLHNIPIPFKGFLHIDLLPLARRLWRDRLPSRALKYLEENLLMAPRSSEEVPGYEIPWLYFDYLRTGDARPLKGVFYHNAMDVVAMSALLRLMNNLLADPHGSEIEHGLDLIALAKLFEDLGRWEDAARLFERGLQRELPEADFWQAVRRLSLLQRRRGNLEQAAALWKQAAAQGHIYAHVELAKYYEHHCKDFSSALHWVDEALSRLQNSDMPAYVHRHWQEDLEKRKERLLKKVK
jgi:uncharacterized protein YprB with RNaseH-like and TPR domain